MSQRAVLQLGDPRLKAPNKTISYPLSTRIKQIIQDLVDTMRHNELVGIAAPQIGSNFTIIVTEPRETKTRTKDQSDILRIYINPRITYSSKQQTVIYEGCGSVAHGTLFGPVKRSKQITIEAEDISGQTFSLSCDGLLARVILHEYDHLNGIEFTEKITDYTKLISVDHYIKNIKSSLTQVKNSLITTLSYSTS